MQRVGIKDFKQHATRILKGVREEGARYVVTYHGRPTAVILPLDRSVTIDADDVALEAAIDRTLSRADLSQELDALRAEIEQGWRSEQSAAEIVSKQRR